MADTTATSSTATSSASRLKAFWYMAVLAFRADPARATAALGASAITAASQATIAFLTSRLIGAAVRGDGDEAIRLAIIVALTTFASMATSLLRLDLRFRMEESVSLLVDRDIIQLTAGIPGLEHHERPEYLDRLELVRQQRGMLGHSVGALVENVGTFASIVSTTGLLAAIDIRLVLLPLFGIPSLVASAQGRKWFQVAQDRNAEPTRLSNHLFELATTGPPAKELRVFGLRDEIRDRYTKLTEGVHRDYDRTTLRSTLLGTAGWAIFAFGYIGAIVFVVTQAVDGQLPVQDVVLVVTLAGQVNNQVSGVYWMVAWMIDTLKAVSRYLGLIEDAKTGSMPTPDPADPPDRLVSGIDLVDVAFQYPGTERAVLEGVNLHLPAGSTVAVVGDNGAGKSTLMKLLCRFYDPTSGVVLVDGVDLRRIPVEQWRERMAAGFQDFARIELLARETVGVGYLPDLDDVSRVQGALERASATDVPLDLVDGLETPVGRSFEGGVELSGGQWQKLALGRALMREAPLLLVLDEPTAALDADTEHALFERFAGAARVVAAETGGITVLVSHRFSTVRMADLILVVGDGAITEAGSHDELMALGGTYAELYELQARAYR